MSPLKQLKMKETTVPQNFNYLIDRNLQENKNSMEKQSETSSSCLSCENKETKLRGDKFKVEVKMYFIKDFLINLQISPPQNSAEAWRLEGLKAKVWMLFCQIKTGTFSKELRADKILPSLKV